MGGLYMTQILIVDDEETIREVLTAFLEQHGYKVAGAETGEKGVEMARSLEPSVILLDVAMPGMSGIEALKILRREAPQSTVIMISGHADHATALQAIELGAHDFIEKPFDLAYLEKVLVVNLALSGEGPGSGTLAPPVAPSEAASERGVRCGRHRGRP